MEDSQDHSGFAKRVIERLGEEPKGFSSLGSKNNEFTGTLESFQAPYGITCVTLECAEVTGICPVTSQPDFYNIVIKYLPRYKCIESKSLKLYMQTFRQKGIFCESLSVEIAEKVTSDIFPWWVEVTVNQTPRGGIAISSFTRIVQEGGGEFV